MEELKDVVSYLVRLSGSRGVNRTVLTKLVYFAELESWGARGEPLTGTTFYRHHYGAWAPDVQWVAERTPNIGHRRGLSGIYLEHRYRLNSTDYVEELTPEARILLGRVYAAYGGMTANYIGHLSKESPPMLESTEQGARLDLSTVAPRRPRLRVKSAELARAQAQLDDSVRGTKAELDARARSEFVQWAPARRRAAQA